MIEKGVIEYFNISEKDFLKRGPTVNLIEKVEEKWFKKHMKLNSSDKILDFASGLGRWTQIIHKQVREIIAIDIASKLIRKTV